MPNKNIAGSELNIKDDDTVLIFQELILDAASLLFSSASVKFL